jgi:hypothetical protein
MPGEARYLANPTLEESQRLATPWLSYAGKPGKVNKVGWNSGQRSAKGRVRAKQTWAAAGRSRRMSVCNLKNPTPGNGSLFAISLSPDQHAVA